MDQKEMKYLNTDKLRPGQIINLNAAANIFEELVVLVEKRNPPSYYAVNYPLDKYEPTTGLMILTHREGDKLIGFKPFIVLGRGLGLLKE
tara:strand:+ start:101 stop:370 length:270 start_codon:yes stop_codon:yes gene_type:complete